MTLCTHPDPHPELHIPPPPHPEEVVPLPALSEEEVTSVISVHFHEDQLEVLIGFAQHLLDLTSASCS